MKRRVRFRLDARYDPTKNRQPGLNLAARHGREQLAEAWQIEALRGGMMAASGTLHQSDVQDETKGSARCGPSPLPHVADSRVRRSRAKQIASLSLMRRTLNALDCLWLLLRSFKRTMTLQPKTF